MNKRKLIFNILGLVVTTAYYTATLVMESKRKTKISDEDKNDIANKVIEKLVVKEEPQMGSEKHPEN